MLRSTVLLAATLSVVVAWPGHNCPTKDSDKTDCGIVGTNQTGCEGTGCCWSPSNTSGTPWCFYKAVRRLAKACKRQPSHCGPAFAAVGPSPDLSARLHNRRRSFQRHRGIIDNHCLRAADLKFVAIGLSHTTAERQVATMRKFFLNNINIDGSGAVVAGAASNTLLKYKVRGQNLPPITVTAAERSTEHLH